jgi:hypothetical protein
MQPLTRSHNRACRSQLPEAYPPCECHGDGEFGDAIRTAPSLENGLRPAVHLILLGGYALALLSLLLRPRKAIGATALVIAYVGSYRSIRSKRMQDRH